MAIEPADITWSDVTYTITTDNTTTTGGTYPPDASITIGDAGIWEVSGTGYTRTEVAPPLIEQIRQLFPECLVCGEEGFLLCEICKEAIVGARKDLFQGMLLDMMEMEGKDEMRLHQGWTGTGSLVHAVQLISRGKYVKRALCGVKITQTTARYFDKAGEQCQRCKHSMEKQSA